LNLPIDGQRGHVSIDLPRVNAFLSRADDLKEEMIRYAAPAMAGTVL